MYIWDKDKYSVGIDEIDEQHEYMFSLIKEIYYKIIDNDEESIKVYLYKALEHANNHFKTEISYLIINKIPEIEIVDHINEHYYLHERLNEILKKLLLDNGKIMIDMALFINKWISEHIIEYDIVAFNKIKENKIQ